MRLVNEGLALVEATAEVKPAAATGGAAVSDFVLVKPNGRWLIESAHETIAHLPPQTNHLKELDWLVGDWSSETSKAGITLRTTCDWTANQAFLIRKFKVEGKEAILHGGTEIIGWDPRTNRIRSWVFDSDGGFGENVWVHDGNRWLIKYSGTLADGSEASATHILTNVDAGHRHVAIEGPRRQRGRAAGHSGDRAEAASRDRTAASRGHRSQPKSPTAVGTNRRKPYTLYPSLEDNISRSENEIRSWIIPQSDLGHSAIARARGAVVLTATVKALPGQEAAVRQALLELVAPSRSEPGCLCYNLHESEDETGLFIFYEQWASQAAFDAHVQPPLPRP